MPNQKLVEYIKTSLDKNITEDQIRENLSQAGWPKEEIESAFSSLENSSPEVPLPETKSSNKKEKSTPVIVIVIIALSVLVVLGIFGLFSGIAFVSLGGARLSAYDTQIRSELSQTRSSAEQHYYDNGGSYQGYNNSDRFLNIAERIPDCSRKILERTKTRGKDSQNFEAYQISVEEKKYTAWAPLCSDSDTRSNQYVYFCVDNTGHAERWIYQEDQFNGDEVSCEDVFGIENRF